MKEVSKLVYCSQSYQEVQPVGFYLLNLCLLVESLEVREIVKAICPKASFFPRALDKG